MVKIVPLQPVPSQTLQANLSAQSVRLNVYQKDPGLFCDVYSNGALVIGGVVCRNINRIVRDLYLGFVGDFIFVDTQGVGDPEYAGLGSRYLLAYLDETDLAGQG